MISYQRQLLQSACVAMVLWASLAVCALAQGGKEASVFFYGNSLVNHLSETEETAVPVWLHRLAEADGNRFAAAGTFGFLRNFSANLPPESQWQFRDVPSAWDADRLAFRRAGFDTIVINPANFIQYQPAHAEYDGDNPRGESPLTATLRVMNWTETKARGARFMIYEGWAEMAGVVRSFPPSARQLRKYQAFNRADYHQWYVDYVAALKRKKTDLDVTLIPVASVLARLLSETDLAELSAQDLYVDDAPHGTPTLYFLASLITYSAIYGMPPPADFVPPETVHPMVRKKYGEVAAFVWAATSGVATQIKGATLAPETGVADPMLAMGLNGVADWSSQQPFVDVMKTARPWIGHLKGQWGGFDAAKLEAGGFLNAAGWPIKIPEEVTRLETLFLTDLPAGEASVSGRYRVQYKGSGALGVVGSARNVDTKASEIWFDFRPGEGGVALALTATDASDPIRDITIVRENQIELHDIGVTFNPNWIARIRDLRSIRFMDWMYTNASPVRHWNERADMGDYTYVRRGVPLEVMIELSNQIGADPWFNIPHMADDAYVAQFAEMVRNTLDPKLKTYVEYSNEIWNFIFAQTLWAQDQARERWGDAAGDDAWMQFAGMRAAEVMGIWSAIYGESAKARLVRVVGAHTGWPGLEEPMLEAALYVAENPDVNKRPAESFDAYAVSGYFGYELGTDEYAPKVLEAIAEGNADEQVATMLRNGSLGELVGAMWPYHAAVSKRYGLDMVMYEGGTHVTGHEIWTENQELGAFFREFNYSSEMARLYGELLTGWRATGGTLFNAFVDVSTPTKWGSWGALRHLDDNNPRWATLMAYNSAPAEAWEERVAQSFDHGVLRWGEETGEELVGTTHEDILVGRGGDDVLIAAGGADRLHGGAGRDRAVLVGAFEDYVLRWDGAQLIAEGDAGRVVMVGIEELAFTAAPSQIHEVPAAN